MKYKCLLLTLFCVICAITVNAQNTHPVTSAPSATATHFDPEKATTTLINTISPAVRAKADSYSEGGYWLILWNFLYAAFIAWLFLFAGLSAYIKKLSGITAKTNLGNLIYIGLYLILSFLLTLPIDCYQNFIREQQYGFSNQDFGQWLLNNGLTFFVELIIVAPFFLLIYFLFRKVKEYWWIWGSVATIIVIIGVLIIYPIFIAPVFNNYTPLNNGPLKERLLSMARANAVDINELYVYNESQQTTAFNANVSGIAGTARIALNDNILHHCTNNEIVAIIGHEMGHYVMHHLIILVIEFGLLVTFGFWLVKWISNKLIIKYGSRWQIIFVQDVTSLPLLIFLFTAYFFIITPITNSITRVVEIEADNYGLNAAHQPDAIASVFIKTADNHKIAPGYWEEIFFFDHPSRQHRILAAMKWKAENLK